MTLVSAATPNPIRLELFRTDEFTAVDRGGRDVPHGALEAVASDGHRAALLWDSASGCPAAMFSEHSIALASQTESIPINTRRFLYAMDTDSARTETTRPVSSETEVVGLSLSFLAFVAQSSGALLANNNHDEGWSHGWEIAPFQPSVKFAFRSPHNKGFEWKVETAAEELRGSIDLPAPLSTLFPLKTCGPNDDLGQTPGPQGSPWLSPAGTHLPKTWPMDAAIDESLSHERAVAFRQAFPDARVVSAYFLSWNESPEATVSAWDVDLADPRTGEMLVIWLEASEGGSTIRFHTSSLEREGGLPNDRYADEDPLAAPHLLPLTEAGKSWPAWAGPINRFGFRERPVSGGPGGEWIIENYDPRFGYAGTHRIHAKVDMATGLLREFEHDFARLSSDAIPAPHPVL